MRRAALQIAGTLRVGPSVRKRTGDRFPFAIGLAIAFGVARVTPSYAHMGTGLPGGFDSGFRHPFTGWDHLLAMVSVGIWEPSSVVLSSTPCR